MPHEVFIPAATTLPLCRQCKHLVQFAPLIAAEAIEGDLDFGEELSATA